MSFYDNSDEYLDNVQYDTFNGNSADGYHSASPYVTNPKRKTGRFTVQYVGNGAHAHYLTRRVKWDIWYRTYSMRNWDLIVNPSIWDKYR